MFQLTREELRNLRSQIATSSWGGRRYHPYAFTEQGVAMLSSVLRSKRAIQVNVEIMRAFVRLRRMLASNEELARKVGADDIRLFYFCLFNFYLSIMGRLRRRLFPRVSTKRRKQLDLLDFAKARPLQDCVGPFEEP